MQYKTSGIRGDEIKQEQPFGFSCPPQQSSMKIPMQYLTLGTVFLLLFLLVIVCCGVIKSPLLAVAAVAALAIAWVAIVHPWLAAWFVFLGAGIPSFLLPLPGHPVRPVEITLALCLVLFFLFRPSLHIKVPHILALLFLMVAVISFIHVPEISTGASTLGANKRLYNLLIILVALFCGTFMADFIRNISSFLVAVLLSNIPLYLISLAQAAGVHLPPLLSPDQNPALTGDAGRLVGPFDGAATFGIYLTGLFAISISCWLLGSSRRDRYIGAVMMFVTILALVGSGTRSALLAMGAMLLIALLVTRRFKLSLFFVVLALAGFIAFPNIILSHFTHAQTSTSNRLFLWNEALKLIIAHPVIGIGLEQFHYYYNTLNVSQSTQLNQHGISVHNQYLEWAMESGIPWLLVGVSFLFSIVVTCLRSYHVSNHTARLPLLAAALLATATLITSFLDVPMDSVESGVFLCMLAGLALGYIFPRKFFREVFSF